MKMVTEKTYSMNLRSAGIEQVHQHALTWPHAEGISRAEHFVVDRVKRSADFESVGTRVWRGWLFGHRIIGIRLLLVLIHRSQIRLPFTQRQKNLSIVEPRVIRGIDHEKPATPDTRPNGLEVGAPLYSINDKMLGAGEPLRVQSGQRILMRLLNASASQIHRLALPAHKFQVVALDGNPVPSPQLVSVIEIAPGERVDAIVEMNQPGVWILGELRDVARTSGMGIVVEYANQAQPRPQWLLPAKARWDYTIFGKTASHPAPDQTIDMVFEKVPGGAHGINHWLVNGKEYPHDREFVFRQGGRYRLVFHNRSDDSHPVHMHRHLFEIVEINGKPTAGIMKDTVIVPAFGRAAVDLVADQPGLTLFHCHIQQHMDFGFKALFRYA